MTEFSNRELLPPQNKNKWNSGYKSVVLRTLEEVFPADQVLEKTKKIEPWLVAIDKEVVDNFGVFESENGVKFPFTKVRIGNVANSVQNKPLDPEAEKNPNKTIVVFTPFTPPPGGGPDDIMNIVYDRVFMALSDTIKRENRHIPAQNITVYALGLPTSQWGTVTEEWLSDLKKHGFSEYGKLYSEFLRTVLGEGKVLFYAGSMGTILASETAVQLPEFWKNLKLLLNNPTGVHEPSTSEKEIVIPFFGKTPISRKGLQTVVGFGAEAAIRKKVPFVDSLVKQAVSGAKPAREALSAILQQKGITPDESDEQKGLKKNVNLEAINFLMKGTPLDTDNVRSYIEQGMLDPATTSIARVASLVGRKKWFKAGKRSLGKIVKFTHWMDPGRWPEKWIGRIEAYEKAVKEQTKSSI